MKDFTENPDITLKRLLEQGRKAITEDGAETLVLGCTADYRSFHTLQGTLGVPVLDAVIAPFKYAEMLTDNAIRFSWFPSRTGGNESPPEAEIKNWGLFTPTVNWRSH